MTTQLRFTLGGGRKGMILIEINLGRRIGLYFQNSSEHPALHDVINNTGVMVVEAESTRLFDVCNAVFDALESSRPSSISEIDADVLGLIERGAIPQVPKLRRGEILEFIQKITFALSSISRLTILRELHGRPLLKANVAVLEMVTGIASQTLRRHLKILTNCRLISRVRVGQTYLYESLPMRLATLGYLWSKLIGEEISAQSDTLDMLAFSPRVQWPDEQRHTMHHENSTPDESATDV